MVARVVWDHEAAGSSPVTSTRLSLDASRVPSLAFSFALRPAFVMGIYFVTRTRKGSGLIPRILGFKPFFLFERSLQDAFWKQCHSHAAGRSLGTTCPAAGRLLP